MGIDRIGKGSGAPPAAGGAGGTGAPTQARETGKAFSVDKPEGATAVPGTQAADAVHAPSPLAELKAGRLSLDGYLDAKVNEATAHLEGMPPAKLETLKSMLRERLASDPTLAELVTQATGQAPTPPEE